MKSCGDIRTEKCGNSKEETYIWKGTWTKDTGKFLPNPSREKTILKIGVRRQESLRFYLKKFVSKITKKTGLRGLSRDSDIVPENKIYSKFSSCTLYDV